MDKILIVIDLALLFSLYYFYNRIPLIVFLFIPLSLLILWLNINNYTNVASIYMNITMLIFSIEDTIFSGMVFYLGMGFWYTWWMILSIIGSGIVIITQILDLTETTQ